VLWCVWYYRVFQHCIPTRDDAIQSFLWHLAYIALAVSAIPDK
jgi:hypothetical protein